MPLIDIVPDALLDANTELAITTAPAPERLATSPIFDDIPPFYSAEPHAIGVIEALAQELKRVEALLATVQARSFPHNADDALLAIWEQTLGVPVRPAGLSVDERRTTVVSALRSRRSAAGRDWVDSVNELIAGTWTYQENTPLPYQITIRVPRASSWNLGRLQRLLDDITPAHLSIFTTYDDAFLVGVGRVGEDRL